jgi:hypothetical protein
MNDWFYLVISEAINIENEMKHGRINDLTLTYSVNGKWCIVKIYA